MSAVPASRLSLFWRYNGWFGLLCVVAGLLLVASAYTAAALFARSQSTAIETDATVTLLRESSYRRGDGTTESGYSVYVEFLAEGKPYSGSEGVSYWFYSKLSEGQTVPIKYLPDDPDTFWVAPFWTKSWPGKQLRFFGLLALAFGAFLIRGPWLHAGAALRVYANGERSTARVVDIIDASSSRKQAYKLLWEDPNGELKETFKHGKEIQARYPVGGTIEILRDPEGKMPPIWVEDLR
ncbi:MAG: DUF3592 domain-containing protein [Pseudomonadota bacterium]